MLTWFRSRSIRRKMLVMLAIVALFRLGQYIPLPAADVQAVRRDVLFTGPVRILTGNALPRLSVLGLGVYPMIIAEGLMALLVMRSPRLAALAAEGHTGSEELRRYTRRLTVLLALLLGAVVAAVAVRGDAVHRHGALVAAVLVACLTAGGAVSMRLAELLTERGFGDGAGVLIAVQVMALLPGEFHQVQQHSGTLALALLLSLLILTLAANELVSGGERRIPIQYANRSIGRRSYGGQTTYYPMHVSGRKAPIRGIAAALFVLSLAVSAWPHSGWADAIRQYPTDGTDSWYLTLSLLGVGFLAIVNSFLAFSPTKAADRIARYGGFIPGVRPGGPTAAYLRYVAFRLAAARAHYRAVLALVIFCVCILLGSRDTLPGGGTAFFLSLAMTAAIAKSIAQSIAAEYFEEVSYPLLR